MLKTQARWEQVDGSTGRHVSCDPRHLTSRRHRSTVSVS